MPEQRTEEQKQATRAALEARAQLRLAKKYANLQAKWDQMETNKKRLSLEQLNLVSRLEGGSLLAEANRLTMISGNGRFKRNDGTFIDIGGSTGGCTRAVLYDWTPPNLDGEFQ